MRTRVAGPGVVALAVGSCASGAWAQGTITDGDTRYTFGSSGVTEGLGNFDTAGGPDALFHSWWWFRMPGTQGEARFTMQPSSQQYVGNTATFAGTELGRISWTMTWRVFDGPGAAEGRLESTLRITCIADNQITAGIFQYSDLAVGTQNGDDTASMIAPNVMGISDSQGLAYFAAPGAAAYQVAAAPFLRTALNDASATNLNNTGLPFAAGDFAAAWQWSDVTLTPGQSAEYMVTIGLGNIPTPGGIGVLAVAALVGARRRRGR